MPRKTPGTLLTAAILAGICMLPVTQIKATDDDPPMREKYLYTQPDPDAVGGLRATVAHPAERLVTALAIPPNEPRLVYQATITDEGRGFAFHGLPIARYDLVLVFEQAFYEGLTLTQDENTLTAQDRESIAEHINRSVPFFHLKRIHRVAGETGRGGKARAVLQEMRTRSIRRTDPGTRLRSLKLAFSEDVNIGWQLVNTREILHQEIGMRHYREMLHHYYHPRLGNIRVVNTIRDLGAIDLRDARASSNN